MSRYRHQLQARCLGWVLDHPIEGGDVMLTESSLEDWDGALHAIARAIFDAGEVDDAEILRRVGPERFDEALREASRAGTVRDEPLLAFRRLRESTEQQRLAAAHAEFRAAQRFDHGLAALRSVLDDAEQRVAGGARMELSPAPGFDAALEMLERPERQVLAVPGVAALEDLCGGWSAGQMIVVGARPKTGKSLLAMTAALETLKLGRAVLYVSLEMSAAEVCQRWLVMEAGPVDRTVGLAPHREAARRLQSFPLYLRAAPSTVDDVRAAAVAAKARVPLGLVVVDYLGLLRGRGKDDSEYAIVTENSKALKSLALELEAPVLCVHQLSRAAAGEEPRAHHLRSSGQVEADSDQVLLMWRSDDDEGSPAPDIHFKLELARNRTQGGKVAVQANFPAMRFAGDATRPVAERVL